MIAGCCNRVLALSLLSILLVVQAEEPAPVDDNQDGDLPVFQSESDLMSKAAKEEIPYILAIIYNDDNKECKKIVESLNVMEVMEQLIQFSSEELGITERMAAARIVDPQYHKRYYLKGCPNLVLYRQGVPIVFDGENLHIRFNRDEIGQWISSNLNSNVQHLSEENFEHLTQASTGATTGDWIIWLHETKCSDLTMIWEALASRLKHSKVVGEVDITLNPKLAERFRIEDCQKILLLRQGKYYTYTADNLQVHALANFAEISFKNFNAQPVPTPKSPFDEKMEQVATWLKESPYGLYLLTGVTVSLFGGILLLVCQESRQIADSQKKTN